MTLIPHITPRFPASPRYISEVSTMGETDRLSRLNSSGARLEIILAIYRVLGCAYFKLGTPAAENEEGSTVNDNLACPEKGFHK
jgi:hypothetical protein